MDTSSQERSSAAPRHSRRPPQRRATDRNHRNAKAAELRAVLPNDLTRVLDLSKLSLVPGSFRSKELAESHADLLFTVPILGKPALVYVLFEHKSFSDRWTPCQALGYMIDIWETFRQRNPNAAFLPPIIPLVVHHSATGWARSQAFGSLFDPNLGAIPGLVQGLPNFEFHLDDISGIPDEELRQRAFGTFATLAVAALSRSQRRPCACHHFEYLSRVAPSLTPQRLAHALAPYTSKAQDIAMNIVDQLRQEGRQEGQAEGRVLSVLKLMKLKFGPIPPEIEHTVSGAPPERLEIFLERILNAISIDDVVRE